MTSLNKVVECTVSFKNWMNYSYEKFCGVVVITIAQLHSTKPEPRFCVGMNPVCGMSEICNEDEENF